jgi:hypothetical protein
MRVQSRHLHTSLTRPCPSSPQPGVLGVVEHSHKGRRLQYSRYYPDLRIISNITSSRAEVVAGVIKIVRGPSVSSGWLSRASTQVPPLKYLSFRPESERSKRTRAAEYMLQKRLCMEGRDAIRDWDACMCVSGPR